MAEFAKYIGTSTTRRMLERDWRQVGIENQGTVEWSPRNGHLVSRDLLSDEAWDMLASDDGIVFVETDNPTAEQVQEAHVSAAVARMRARAAELAIEADAEAATDASEPSNED